MAAGSGSSKDVNKDRQLSEAQAGIKALSLSGCSRLVEEISRQNSTSEMTTLGQGVPPRVTGNSRVSVVPESSASPFKEQQLKQLRAQCLVYRAFRNGVAPKEQHLETALGATFSEEGD